MSQLLIIFKQNIKTTYLLVIIQTDPPLPPPLRELPTPPSASMLPSKTIMEPTVIFVLPPPFPPDAPLVPGPPVLPVCTGWYNEPYDGPPDIVTSNSIDRKNK